MEEAPFSPVKQICDELAKYRRADVIDENHKVTDTLNLAFIAANIICAHYKELDVQIKDLSRKYQEKIIALKKNEKKLKERLLEMAELADDLKCADINNFFDAAEVDKLIKKARRLTK